MRIEVSVIRDDGTLATKWSARPGTLLRWIAAPGMAITDGDGELAEICVSTMYFERPWSDRIGDIVRQEKK